MKLTTRFAFVGLAALMVAVLAACGTSGGSGSSSGATSADIAPDGENLAFNKATLSGPAGQAFTVNFKNSSTANQHNWVLIKGGDAEAGKVDEEAVTAGPDKGYIPDDPNIVASTKVLDPGGNGTASVNVPAGTYTYICTVPGHYAAGMKGTYTAQ